MSAENTMLDGHSVLERVKLVVEDELVVGQDSVPDIVGQVSNPDRQSQYDDNHTPQLANTTLTPVPA